MEVEQLNAEVAFDEVRLLRPQCDPNLGFWIGLKDWEVDLRNRLSLQQLDQPEALDTTSDSPVMECDPSWAQSDKNEDDNAFTKARTDIADASDNTTWRPIRPTFAVSGNSSRVLSLDTTQTISMEMA